MKAVYLMKRVGYEKLELYVIKMPLGYTNIYIYIY